MSSVALWLGLTMAGMGLDPGAGPTSSAADVSPAPTQTVQVGGCRNSTAQADGPTTQRITIVTLDEGPQYGPQIAQAGSDDDDNPPPHHGPHGNGPNGPNGPNGGPNQAPPPPPPPGFLGGFFGPPRHGPPGERGREQFVETRLEKGTYLGVYTESPDDTLRDQLGLDKGVGLIVEVLDPQGPAKQAGILPHDILYKLDDQFLINTAQLAVLVRNKKPDASVDFTVIRKAAKMTITVKLGEKMLPPLTSSTPYPREMQGDVHDPMGGHEERWDPMAMPPPIPDFARGGWPHRLSNVVIQDGKTILTFNSREGHESLKVEDETGKTIFEGPIDTEENREKLAPEYKKWLPTYDRIAHPKSVETTTQPTNPNH